MDDQLQQNHFEPDQVDLEWYDQLSRGYVGLEKPRVAHSVEPEDRYSYQRWDAAKRLGIDESELEDEPDLEMLDQQGWE